MTIRFALLALLFAFSTSSAEARLLRYQDEDPMGCHAGFHWNFAKEECQVPMATSPKGKDDGSCDHVTADGYAGNGVLCKPRGEAGRGDAERTPASTHQDGRAAGREGAAGNEAAN